MFWFSGHPGVVLRAASRDGSRSDPKHDAAPVANWFRRSGYSIAPTLGWTDTLTFSI
jgi:hypothetical protein